MKKIDIAETDERACEIAIAGFIKEMKAGLKDGRKLGKVDFHNPEETSDIRLIEGLEQAYGMNDFVSVANYAMMLHARAKYID